MKNAVAIRHVAFEDAGTLKGVLEDRGISLNYLEAGVDDLAPAKTADLLLVLGGPIGIYETDRYPFIKGELAIVEAAVKQGTPVIGTASAARPSPPCSPRASIPASTRNSAGTR